MAASNAGDEDCGVVGASETGAHCSSTAGCTLYSGALEPGAGRRDQVQPAPAPAPPLGKAKPSELLRLRRKSWPSAQLQERSHHCTKVSGAMQRLSKVRERRKFEHQLIIRDWLVEQKRESREREKGLSCARRLSGHLIVLWGNKLYSQ